MKTLLIDYGSYLVLGFNMLLGWAFWSARHAFASKTDVNGLQKAIAALDVRVVAAERDLKALPSKDDFHRLQLELTKTMGELNTVSAVLQSERNSLSESMRRHEEALIRHESIFADAARRNGA